MIEIREIDVTSERQRQFVPLRIAPSRSDVANVAFVRGAQYQRRRRVRSRPVKRYRVAPGPVFWLRRELDAETGDWVVHDVSSGIFGSGDSVSAALRDFRRAVREHLDVLERTPDLSTALARQRDYLRERLRG